MPISRQKKEDVLQELKDKMTQASSMVLVDYRGLTVAEMTALRKELRQTGSELLVSKNTLSLKAAKEVGIEGLNDLFEGPIAIAYGYEDLVAPAKVLSGFAKEHKALEIKGGYLEGKTLNLEEIKDLANLPSREVLLAKVLGGMQSPMYGFAGCLAGVLRNFVYALEAIRKQKEENQ